MLVWSISLKLTLHLHLVILRVLDTEIKHRPHADSESGEVTIYFSWELTFGKVDLYFLFPFGSRQPIDTKIDFLAKHVVLDFAGLQV